MYVLQSSFVLWAGVGGLQNIIIVIISYQHHCEKCAANGLI